MPSRQPGGRLSRDDWVEAALEVIAADGLNAVAVEPIAARLGVTKGSFYAHFGARVDLITAALERWRTLDTTEVLASLGPLSDARDRIAEFLDVGFGRDRWGRVFASLCASASDPLVAPVMDEVREERLAFLKAALEELGLTVVDAHDRSTLIYAAYVGFWRLVAADPAWEYNGTGARERMAAHLVATLVPTQDARPNGR